MSAVEVEPSLDRSRTDPVTTRLDAVLAELESLVGDCTPIGEPARIDRISRLEKLRSAVAAVQAAEMVRLGQARVAAALARKGGSGEVDAAVVDLAPDPLDLARSGCGSTVTLPDDGVSFNPARIGAGLIDEVGLACRLSPWQAARRLRVARALWFDLPRTFAALTTGGLSEHVADIIVRETRQLDHRQRAEVDTQLVDAGITELGWRAAEALAKQFAYQQDRRAYVDRSQLARDDRTVTLRPAPDSMAFLTGLLPLEQGVSCVAALGQAADSAKATGDGRSRGQIMADTLVQRITGQATATDLNLEVQIVLPVELLTDPTSTRTATVQGYGPLPGGIATEFIDASQGRKTWRTVWTQGPAPEREAWPPCTDEGPPVVTELERVDEDGSPSQFRDPVKGSGGTGAWPQPPIVEIDSKRRFTGRLAALIRVRDQRCRVPYCGAAIRHLDHIRRHRDGGQTILENGQGLCERHNQVRETEGWQTNLINSGRNGSAHAVDFTTPTGHRYRSRAPDPP